MHAANEFLVRYGEDWEVAYYTFLGPQIREGTWGCEGCADAARQGTQHTYYRTTHAQQAHPTQAQSQCTPHTPQLRRIRWVNIDVKR